ncbi:hypothetical protein KKA08_01345, partial [bacterium]|nr:hypothetical protein [bacterium]
AMILFIAFAAFSGNQSDPRSELAFSHMFHVDEVGAACDDCHAAAKSSHHAYDNIYPGMEQCAECHDVEDKSECSTCHSDPENVIPASGVHENYDFFKHSSHSDAGLTCAACHADIVKSTEWTADQQLLPVMDQCVSCHSERGQTLECAACHQGVHPQPGDHTFMEWSKTHGLEAALDPERFQQYFELGYCEDCHQGLNLKGEVHQTGWLFVHGDEAAVGGECFVCHEDRSGCASCHQTMLPTPHPLGIPSFANAETGGTHKEDAQAFFEACITCHEMGQASPTCARCH